MSLAVLIAGHGGSAVAAVTGLQRVHAESPSDSTNKSVTATCPAGKRVVGAGGEIINGAGQVALTDVIPNSSLANVTAEALEDQDGYANDWRVRAHAICATPPPGLELVVTQGPDDSSNKTVTAACPTGKRRLGGGAEIKGASGQVVLDDIRLNGLASTTAQGIEDQDGTLLSWRLDAHAICANPVHLLERVEATSPNDSTRDKSATATCPAGKRVVGAGSEIGGGGGQVVTDDLRSSAAMDSVTAQAFEDQDGITSDWFVRAVAICAAASQRVVGVSPTNSSLGKSLFVDCPTDLRVTGLGGEITGGGGQVRLAIFRVFALSSSIHISAGEDHNGYAGLWTLRAYAICTTPLPGVHLVGAESATDSSAAKSATAICPVGERVIGGGGFPLITPSVERPPVMQGLAPNPGLTTFTATAHEPEGGDTGSWRVIAFAICAPPPPALELVTATSAVSSSNKSSVAACPGDKHLLGTGGAIVAGLGQVVLDDLVPEAALKDVTVVAVEDDTGFASGWSVRAYAICANP